MASPDGLRLYLGSRAPSDVLDLLFQYGFHLWLAQPWDVTAQLGHRGRWAPIFWTTRHIVRSVELSSRACRLVKYGDYLTDVNAIGTLSYRNLARPRIWQGHVMWDRVAQETREWVVVPDEAERQYYENDYRDKEYD